MRGQKVIVRAYGDKPEVVLIWQLVDMIVVITDEDGYKKLMNGDADSPMPIGFKRELVYEYDGTLPSALNDLWEAGSWMWEGLTQWQPSN